MEQVGTHREVLDGRHDAEGTALPGREDVGGALDLDDAVALPGDVSIHQRKLVGEIGELDVRHVGPEPDGGEPVGRADGAPATGSRGVVAPDVLVRTEVVVEIV